MWANLICFLQEKIGIFLEGLLFKQRGGMHAAKLQETKEEGLDQQTGCTYISFVNSHQYVPCKKILRAAAVHHDCLASNCSVKEVRTVTTIEQRDTLSVQKIIKHRSCNRYLVNKYAL